MTIAEKLQLAGVIVQAVGLGGTFVAAILALKTFRRNEQWKRAEFLADEMKEFFDDKSVQHVLLLIDWGVRKIPLLDTSRPDKGIVMVTRDLQVQALLPHILLNGTKGSDVEGGVDCQHYTTTQASIRDKYDVFLDGLERFASYVETGLIEPKALRPYLGYWIDDIQAPAKDPEDAAWCATLLTYIAFYRFTGVMELFRKLDRSIDPQDRTYAGFLHQMTDQRLAQRLAATVGVTYYPQHNHL